MPQRAAISPLGQLLWLRLFDELRSHPAGVAVKHSYLAAELRCNIAAVHRHLRRFVAAGLVRRRFSIADGCYVYTLACARPARNLRAGPFPSRLP